MNINYKVEDEFFKVTFCPDNQGLNLKKKKLFIYANFKRFEKT